MSTTMHSDVFAHIREANRLFLGWLQTLADGDLERMGFPSSALEALRRADSAALEALAEFPRALFRVRFSAAAAALLPAEGEVDPVKRAALFIKMNDVVIQNVVVIPVLWRNGVSGAVTALQGMDLTGWDSNFWRLAYWYKQA